MMKYHGSPDRLLATNISGFCPSSHVSHVRCVNATMEQCGESFVRFGHMRSSNLVAKSASGTNQTWSPIKCLATALETSIEK